MKHSAKTPNALIHETSPYLLQHAYNPVNWLPFSEAVFQKAKKENKLVLISIGYSACHWCHVMEHESFEDNEVADLMNKYYVNIKVDREERSDVDMLYMQAVQLMTGRGGWPLNCFVLPDGRPFYGGTYFTKAQWLNVLKNLVDIQQNNPDKLISYSEELTKGIKQSEIIATQKSLPLDLDAEKLKRIVEKWKSGFDNEEGGPNRAPKFPLPNNYLFLVRYAIIKNDHQVLEHVHLTLTKMAMGGIYDQLHGGFARYSTDMLWKVPHFEKMLYDNSQLISLYCEAFQYTNNRLYEQTVRDTLSFIEAEWRGAEGNFYSAYDADSDGEEGKYYVWTQEDLTELLGEEFDLFSMYFEINKTGYWEHGNYILMRSNRTSEILIKYKLSVEDLERRIEACKEILKQESKSRLKPGLDDKTITSWNAMMCSAYAKAYLSFDEETYKSRALQSMAFMLKHLLQTNGKLYRTYKNGEAKIDGFLEDYAFTVEALLNCYLISQDEKYLEIAKSLCELSLSIFSNPDSPLLFYTDKDAKGLVLRITETSDNVIPASNSQMALNLFYLSKYFGVIEWQKQAESMLNCVSEEMLNYGPGYSNWAILALHLQEPFYEVAIVGKHVDEKLRALYKRGLTNTIFAVSSKSSEMALLKNRWVEGKTMLYVCRNNTCQLPVEGVEEALQQFEKV